MIQLKSTLILCISVPGWNVSFQNVDIDGMACSCEIKKMQSELERVSDLAKKAAILDGCIYVVYQKEDGTYAFDKLGVEIKGKIVEYRHYL